jgi:hypothetical protein|tara:strand:- start:1106 stop:1213 length:108 start_codon:yes stop_codon:yes gene_type:complete
MFFQQLKRFFGITENREEIVQNKDEIAKHRNSTIL